MRRRPAVLDGALEMSKLYEALTRLRALIFLRHFRQGITYGETLLHMSEAWYLHWYMAEVSLLLAVIYHAEGEKPAARRMMETALDIGRREGYVQLFLADWDIVEPAFQQYDKHVRSKLHTALKPVVAYCDRLLQFAENLEQRADPLQAARRRLTAKEYEVLPALIAGKSNAAIAEQLSVRIQTVKTHCKAIYKKLMLTGRKEAAEQFASRNP